MEKGGSFAYEYLQEMRVRETEVEAARRMVARRVPDPDDVAVILDALGLAED
jgi:hypothetical protein